MNSGSRFTDRLNSTISSTAGTLRASLLASVLALTMGFGAAQDQQTNTQPQTQQTETSQTQTTTDQTTTEMGAAGDETVIQIGPDQTITEAQFEQEFQRAVRLLAAQQGIPYNEETRALFERFRADFLNQLATQQALLQEAQARGITVDEAQVEQQITQAQESFGGEEEFQQALQEFGYDSIDTYRQTVREGLLAQQVVDQLRADIQVSDQEIQSFYEQNQQTFGDATLDQVRDQVEAQLVNERLTEQFASLQQQYGIQTFPDVVAAEPTGTDEGIAGGGEAEGAQTDDETQPATEGEMTQPEGEAEGAGDAGASDADGDAGEGENTQEGQ